MNDFPVIKKGNFFNENYKHCSVDVELHIRLTHKNLISYCPQAKIIHRHYFCTSRGEKADKKDKWNELVDSYTMSDRKLLPIRLKEMKLWDEAHRYSNWLLDTAGFPRVNTCIDLRERFKDINFIPIGGRVMNVGIGEGISGVAKQLPLFFFNKLTHVEPHMPYIESDLKRKYNTEDVQHIHYPIQNITDFTGYDLIMAFDVLEHLKKEESLAVLDKMESSNAKILIFIPLEEEFRPNSYDAESQDHLSLWTEEDFKQRGYKTIVLPDFHNEGGKTFSALWAMR